MKNFSKHYQKRIAELKAENARLKAEVERLTALVESNLNQSKRAMANSDAYVRSLEAQVERLTKAGDAMAAHIERNDELCYIVLPDGDIRISDWHAAKEGKGQP